MSYTKHDFKSGEKLYAQQLNEMDEQIFKNTEETSKLSEEIADLKENGTGTGGSGNIFADYVNVKDYGATGDGETDDSTAIQSAINKASENGGGIVYLPKGVYVLKSPLMWETNVSLIGDGIGKSILKTVSDEPVLGFSAIYYDTSKYGTSNLMKNCVFKDFEIDGSGLQVSVVSWRGKGIFIIGLENCIFENILIRETCATGLGIDALRNVQINGVMCINCGRTWVKQNSEVNIGCAGIGIGTNMIENEYFVITNCMTKGCGNMGIFLEDQKANGNLKTQYCIISNNIVLDGKNVGIGVRGTQKLNITNNIINGNVYGIEFSRINKNIHIQGNSILNNEYGIYDNSISVDSIDIFDNVIEDNSKAGICFVNTTTLGAGTKEGVLVKGNKLKNNINSIDITGNIYDLMLIENLIERNTMGILIRSGVLTDGYILRNILRKNSGDYSGISALSGNFVNDLEVSTLTGISMTQSMDVALNGNAQLTVKPIPTNAKLDSSIEVIWESDNQSVSTVENGLVTGISEGTATIIAHYEDFTATCLVTVKEIDIVKTIYLADLESECGYYSDDGLFVSSDTGHYITKEFIPVKDATIFRGSDVNGTLIMFDSNYDMVSKYDMQEEQTKTFNIGDNVSYIKIELNALTAYNNYSFIFGENLYTAKNLLKCYVDASGNEVSDSSQYTTEEYMLVESNAKYLLICNKGNFNMLRVIEYDADKTFIKRTLNLKSNSEFTTEVDSSYLRIGYSVPTSSDSTIETLIDNTILLRVG